MHSFHIDAMVEALVKSGTVSKDQKEAASEALHGYWSGKIVIIWSIEDVIDCAKQRDMDISEESAEEILDSVDNSHDCNYGITWDTIADELTKDVYEEESKVRQAAMEELPLLLNDLKTEHGKTLLKKRLEKGE